MEIREKLEEIRKMTEGTINELGYTLYHLEYVTEEDEKYLRFYIENKNGEDITLEDCEKVSRRISEIIDENDPIDEPYYLEVSSPGLFRELFTKEHMEKAIGERVEVLLRSDDKSRNHFKGILKSVSDTVITVETEKGDREAEITKIRKINADPEVF